MFVKRVNLKGFSYEIKIGRGILKNLGRELENLIKKSEMPDTSQAIIISDSNVRELYLENCKFSIESKIRSNLDVALSAFSFKAGEESKNFDIFTKIIDIMAGLKYTRSDVVIALGGGVVGDIAGFAAGCYMRGVRFIQVPTTLLAAVDSSVGGKTAIDLKYGKNLVGVFHQPSLVICDTKLLRTLPETEYLCGVAEALKTGILSGEKLFKFFENDLNAVRDNISEIIAQCVDYKAGVVERDEKELGERKLLNLGHTIGHAIELCSDYKIQHGLAVAQGLAIITRAAAKKGWCSADTANRIINSLIKNNLPHNSSFNAEELCRAALADKKRSGDYITLVIPAEIGACELKKVNVNELEEIIKSGLDLN